MTLLVGSCDQYNRPKMTYNVLKLEWDIKPHYKILSAVWLSGNALVSIIVVTLRLARLVPGWVTIFRRVNYLRM